MKKVAGLFFSFFLLAGGVANAHFGMVIPETSTIAGNNKVSINLEISFSHPMEMQGMDMEQPKSFSVFKDGKSTDLSCCLKPASIMDHKAWTAKYEIRRPGVYAFAVEPIPYFEPAEDTYIIHFTKAYVAAFGEEEGWDEPLGLKTEIIPLTRPFGNYAGNLFQGRVLLDGTAVPGAEVEIEYYNCDGKREAPNDYFVTQAVRADENGVFSFVAPWAGWWGFAALNTADETMDYKGEAKPVELGAVLWIELADPQMK